MDLVKVTFKFAFGVFLLGVFLLGVFGQEYVTVSISQGEIKGISEKLAYSRKFIAFRGIPYAKPPTESLRLKEPEKHDVWDTPRETTKFKSECPQWDSREEKIIGDEDCLFINVFTRNVQTVDSESQLHPVMVFIHGGNFQRGSGDPYGPERFLDEKEEIVIVTLNYRLGILGFLSTGDAACPGNLGLKDQVMALQWIRENIKVFGGDRDRVTLFGQDAGAASVFLHILSPKSKDLFKYAITQSGSPLCDWSLQERPYNYAVQIAKRLQCTTKSTGAMVSCIRGKPLSDILNAQKGDKSLGDYFSRAAAVVEKDGFLTDTPSKLLTSKMYDIPLMSGVNKDDGSILYSLINSYGEQLKNSDFLVKELIPMFVRSATDLRTNIEFISQSLLFEYFNDVDRSNVSQVVQAFINMTTDSMFVSCNFKTLQLYSSRGGKVYMYAFQYKGEYNMLDLEQSSTQYAGISHGDELLYLFNITDAKLSSADDKLMSTKMNYLWTHFATNGEFQKVTEEYTQWKIFTNESKDYYRIDKVISSDTSYRQRAVNLWLDHLPTLSKIRESGDAEYRTGGFGWTMFAFFIILLIVSIVLGVMLYRKSKRQYFETKTEDK